MRNWARHQINYSAFIGSGRNRANPAVTVRLVGWFDGRLVGRLVGEGRGGIPLFAANSRNCGVGRENSDMSMRIMELDAKSVEMITQIVLRHVSTL